MTGYRYRGQTNAIVTESWGGSRWTLTPSQHTKTSTVLYGVSCIGMPCMAAGNQLQNGDSRTFTEAWSGSPWTIVPSASEGNWAYLLAVSCPGPPTCAAVGEWGG